MFNLSGIIVEGSSCRARGVNGTARARYIYIYVSNASINGGTMCSNYTSTISMLEMKGAYHSMRLVIFGWVALIGGA